MQPRYLGRTGIRVSPLTLGTMTYGSTTDTTTAIQMVRTAVEHGTNLIDTANVYNHGESERVVGQALKDLGPAVRDRLVVATKCHGNMFKEAHVDDPLLAKLDPNRWGNSRRQIIEQCHASLKRLDVDHIDLYQIHRPHNECATDETLRALDDLVRSGKVRYIGCSTFAAWQVVESLWLSERHGLNRYVTEQPPYHLLDRRIERELVPMAQTYGLGLIPWSPLAGGFLSGKYRKNADAPKDARYSKGEGRGSMMLENDAALDAVEGLAQLADDKGCTLDALALAWVAQQPGISSAIMGPRTPEQLASNLKAYDVEITDADRQRIDDLCPPGRMRVPYYEASFGPHNWR